MCEQCFTEEISSFKSQSEFDEFDLILTMKIGNEKNIKMREFVTTAWKDIGYQIYECLVCGQSWKLSTPELPNTGYFLRLSK
ncbi:hypothetical protein [Phnomibacter sp. MR]|uniref:hypothetical protein n=1 Tax=Phnomibacter sp. MR TaxID=3042318 RepID=UPI003A7F8F93